MKASVRNRKAHEHDRLVRKYLRAIGKPPGRCKYFTSVLGSLVDSGGFEIRRYRMQSVLCALGIR